MPFRSMEQGIAAIQQGKFEEGARLLKIALRSEELKGSLRATAYLWLAESVTDRDQKLRYYNEALAADPDNQNARQRIAQLLASDLPETPPPASREAQAASQAAQPAPQSQQRGAAQYNQRTVGIYDGPNGTGTGFFVTRDGLLATTRFVVGGMERVTVEIGRMQTFEGRVVRSYPQFDLAFVHTTYTVGELPPVSPQSSVPDNTPLMAYAHGGQVLRGKRRATKSRIKPEWFPTTIGELVDAGGNPVFDDQQLMVGMLTTNSNRTSPYVFGLNINVIYRHVEQYLQEIRTGENLVYCSNCGHLSRAGAAGAFYCETCGGILPGAENVRRHPMPKMAGLYGENAPQPCPNCGSRAGFYNSQCLRCGYVLSR